MPTPKCPLCNRIVVLYYLQSNKSGTISPAGYNFNCEHCSYKKGGLDYLKFFGTCYCDKEFKHFVLRSPLQNSDGALIIDVMKDNYSVKVMSPDNSSCTIIEQKGETLTPDEAQQYLLRIVNLMVFA